MARQWRLRHKLLLGVGLVVGTIGLLLAGTLQGLSAYIRTMKAGDYKLNELVYAEALRKSVSDLTVPTPARADQELVLREKLAAARAKLATYKMRQELTQARYGDTHSGYVEMEAECSRQLHTRLDLFATALDAAAAPAAHTGPRPDLTRDPRLTAIHAQLMISAEGLCQAIYDEMFNSIAQAKRQHNHSLAVVVTATTLAVLFTLCLLYFFSSWFFHPIRTLQAGVARVAAGDFDHPIRLTSGDELQELADAFNDMTARVKDTHATLAQQVEDRSRQLVRSERLASVGFLAAGVAHEINNPLASIVFCSEALEDRVGALAAAGTADTEVVQKYLRMIHQQAFRCKEITQRLLEFSRVGDRKREPTDLGALVQSVLEVAQHLPNCKGKRIVFQPVGRVTAPANGPEISSVVLNLAVNALDSMDEGGELTVTLLQRGPWAEVVFADTGCGMTAEVLENIFEPFFTRSRTGKGTGLGLSISHQIVAQHAGAIEASSGGPGKGSTFVVRLPMHASEVPAAPPVRLAA